MNYGECRQAGFLRARSNGIALKSDHIVHVLRWIRECTLPQTVHIGGLLPCPMITFIDHSPQRQAGLLQRAYMIAQKHEQGGIRWEDFHEIGEFTFHGDASARIDQRLAIADRRGPNQRIARSREDCGRQG